LKSLIESNKGECETVKKRKSGGRKGGDKGRAEYIHCYQCGALVPRDKAKKVTVRTSFVDSALVRELRASGAYIPVGKMVKYYCISCAIHYGVVRVRAREERKVPGRIGF